jgi:hexosaminidase
MSASIRSGPSAMILVALLLATSGSGAERVVAPGPSGHQGGGNSLRSADQAEKTPSSRASKERAETTRPQSTKAPIVGSQSMSDEHATRSLPLIPAPASVDRVPDAAFQADPTTRIVIGGGGGVRRVANKLAQPLRRASGYVVPIAIQADAPERDAPTSQATATSGARDIVMRLDRAGNLGPEGYWLDVAPSGVKLIARATEGLFRGVQTLHQLFPLSGREPFELPGLHITDYPRFKWRGAMLDVSRHFFSVPEVKRYIDLIAMYKMNVLHLHLSDDQGWRIFIDRWPRLATHGGSTKVGGGRGGYYTKREYREIVSHAADRFITIVPEIDMPGHSNAALASYERLNCDGRAPPLYTGMDVGFSSLCIARASTYRFVDDVVREIAELTPGPYFHIGGDEAHSTSTQDYISFIERVGPIVADHGKKMLGWEEIARADIAPASLAQHWSPATGSEAGTEPARAAVQRGAQLVMSPADKAYLDMKYDASTPLGLTWAGFTEVRDSYEWDPVTLVDGVRERDVAGVEAPLWSETLENISDVEFMAFPRLPGIAEIGWSPEKGRSWGDYRLRLAAQAPRWERFSVNFYRSPQIDWDSLGPVNELRS